MLFLVLKFNDQTYLVLMFVTMTKNLVCVRNGMKILLVLTFFFNVNRMGTKFLVMVGPQGLLNSLRNWVKVSIISLNNEWLKWNNKMSE